MNWFEAVLTSALGSGIFALCGWLIRTWAINEDGTVLPSDGKFHTLSELIDHYVHLKKSKREDAIAASLENEHIEFEYTEYVEYYEYRVERRDDTLTPLSILVIFLVCIAILSGIWENFKIQMLVITGIGTIVCWVSTFYFTYILDRVPGPLTLTDHMLAWGTMPVWILAITGFTFGVFRPSYPLDVPQEEQLFLMFAQATQAIGAGLLYLSIGVASTLQFVAGSIYRKALRDELPSALETKVWDLRLPSFMITFFSLPIGSFLVSGLASSRLFS